MINKHNREGIRLRFEKGVNPEVRRAILEFITWLRSQRTFPKRVPVYVKADDILYTKDGRSAVAIFFEPFDKNQEPFIKLATGDYLDLLKKWNKANALGSILLSLAHEIGHYDQWIEGKTTNCRGASIRASKIIDKYALTREHP